VKWLRDSGLEFGESYTPSRQPVGIRLGSFTVMTATDGAKESSMTSSLKFEQRLQRLTLYPSWVVTGYKTRRTDLLLTRSIAFV